MLFGAHTNIYGRLRSLVQKVQDKIFIICSLLSTMVNLCRLRIVHRIESKFILTLILTTGVYHARKRIVTASQLVFKVA